ncbi:MAG: TauD/TfdA dioxygenase family protein [Betaproteobacteria bacterium]
MNVAQQALFQVRRLGAAPFGGEVRGFDLKRLLRAPDNAEFLHTLCEHGVLVFREQYLTPEDFVAISRFCGELDFHVLDQYRMPERAEIYVLSNIVRDGRPIGDPKNGFGWHTDLSYMQHPTAYTVLYGVDTPPEGADTLYTSTRLALQALDPGMRKRIEGRRGVHSYTYMRERNAKYRKENIVAAPLTAEQIARTPDVLHPLVRTNPITQDHSLYLGGDCITGIEGMPEAEARPLLDRLFEFALRPEFQLRHVWQPRDVVFWDNRSTMHTATEYDRDKYRRLIWRASVKGEVPY